MFGYVRAFPPEMKIKEHNLYRAVYCGLCRSIGKNCGECSRLTLSYDMTFLAVVRLAIEKTPYSVKNARCFAHPTKKRPIMDRNAVLDYTARASAVLNYGKLLDDIADSPTAKKTLCTLARPIMRGAKNKARLDDLYKSMTEKLAELACVEKAKTPSVDIPLDIFGKITAELFSFGLSGSDGKIAESIGFHTGRWIYAVDAVDDLRHDTKSGSYNPILQVFGENISRETADSLNSALMHELTQIENALDLIDYADDSLKAIIYNILYEGMARKSNEVSENLLKTEKELKIEQKSLQRSRSE